MFEKSHSNCMRTVPFEPAPPDSFTPALMKTGVEPGRALALSPR